MTLIVSALAIVTLGTATATLLGGDQGGAAAGTIPIGTSFTYQGRLSQSGVPVNGKANLVFTLWPTQFGGTQVPGTDPQSFPLELVNEGLISLTLDFGATAFDGSERWLQIVVDGNTLPRQAVTPSPYTLHAVMAGDADLLDGLDSANFLRSDVPGVVTSFNLATDPDSFQKVTDELADIQNGEIRFLKSVVFIAEDDSNPSVLSFRRPDGGSAATIRLADGESHSLWIRASSNSPWLFFSSGNPTAAPIRCFNPSTHDWYRLQAASFEIMSSRELKRNIEYLDNADQAQCLQQVLALRPARYSMRWEEATEAPDEARSPHMGFIAEDLPSELLNATGDAVDLYALVTAAVVAIKQSRIENDREIERLRAQKDVEIEQLRERVGQLERLFAARGGNEEGARR